ncbi:hypothetical protein MW887_007349 [Aspergillus wentii]|nr:hypothetical protein MW887_007349 [Aspergillus wentii]
MLAVRDQENLVHAHQTVAASKPLNQGVKQLQPKTPGARAPKTPFKVPLNDENDPLAFGKKTVKGNGKRTENAKPAKDAFVTPLADPRHRAPLGMKTTNAKAKGIQTPAPGAIKPEKTNKRASTQRIKKFAPLVEQNQAEVQEQAPQDDVPDIEYMPPKPKELPDYPEDITYDTTFPQFKPQNLALGLESVYGDNEVGKDGLTKKQRKFQENSIACDKMVDDMILKQVEGMGFEESNGNESLDAPQAEELPKRRTEARCARVIPSRTKYSSNISTVRAKDAATALSGAEPTAPRKPAPLPKPRVASSLLGSRKPRVPSNPSSMRQTAATANARTTVGYSKGRTMSSKLHGKISTTPKEPAKGIQSPETYIQLYGPPPLGTEMWLRCKAAGCFDSEEERQEAQAEMELPTYEEDAEAQDFQLTL